MRKASGRLGRNRLVEAAAGGLMAAVLGISVSSARAQPMSEAQNSAPSAVPAMMPLPAHMEKGTGAYRIDAIQSVSYAHFHDARLDAGVARMLQRLQFQSGVPLPRTATEGAAAADVVIDVRGSGGAVQPLEEDESYRLRVTPQGVELKAATVVGALHAMETLLQLATVENGAAVLPVVSIDDAPRFRWRGLMIDVSRHFEPVSQIERTLDGMAMVKMNVFHWHLSDDTGFRAESLVYPRLTGMGSNGEYYTQTQMRGVVAYARARGIRVVPEFDMPGHIVSWLVGYPELSSSPGPFHVPEVAGIHDEALDPTRESTYLFIDKLVAEMVTIFPDAYFHIGGDESEGKTWMTNPKITAFMRQKGYQRPAQLQAYFSQRVRRIVEKHGRQPIGWDEILVPGLPKSVVVQSWRGADSLAAGAKQGYRGILSAPYYLDAMKTTEQHYLADPIPSDTTLTPEQQTLILGGEVCMWAEQLDERTIDSRIWPRTAAIAERFWSPQSVRDVSAMYQRLPAVSLGLEQVGLTHLTGPARMRRSILASMAGGQLDPERLKVLTDVLEPVSFDQREQNQHTDSRMPLDRLVDVVVPDPPSRDAIARDVDAVVNGTGDKAEAEARLMALFVQWKSVAPLLEQEMAQNPRMSDAAVRAKQLGVLGSIGLSGLSGNSANPVPGGTRQSALDFIASADNPAGLVRFTFLEPLKKLVGSKLGM
jgi:hexosaminidase